MATRPPLERRDREVVAVLDPHATATLGLGQPWLAHWHREVHLLTMVGYPDGDTGGTAFVISDQNNGQDLGASYAVQQALVIAYNGTKDGRLPFDAAAHERASVLSGEDWERIDGGVVMGAPVPGWKRQWGAYVIRLFAHPRVLTAVVRESTHDRDPSPALIDLGDEASRLPLRDPRAPLPPRQR